MLDGSPVIRGGARETHTNLLVRTSPSIAMILLILRAKSQIKSKKKETSLLM